MDPGDLTWLDRYQQLLTAFIAAHPQRHAIEPFQADLRLLAGAA
jgi:hypothetical protein